MKFLSLAQVRAFSALLFLIFIFSSCQKEVRLNKPDDSAIFPTTEKQKETVSILKEVATILKDVYQNPKAYYEANAAIYSEYYVDESVLLKDLLFPEISPLYKTESFKKRGSPIGEFKKEFFTSLHKGDFPYLKKAMGIIPGNNNLRTQTEIPTDTALEIFSNSDGIAIYFPYSENFGSSFTPAYFDNINTNPFGNLATIVAADRESDSGPGSEPYRHAGPNRTDPIQIWYRSVTVNDDYAELHPTHIVGVGAEPARVNGSNQTNQVYVVFIGEVKCTHQYDHLISLTGNGGGSNLRFCRGSGYFTQDGNGQITNPQNVVQANPKRKQIRKEQWVPVYGMWDADWQPDNLNQVFAIYEEDTQGSSTVNISLQTTVQLTPGSGGGLGTTGTRTVGFSWTFKTQDDIIRQLAWSRQSFYQYNQGGLNNGCGTRNGWTIYDCNSYVTYTMPTQ